MSKRAAPPKNSPTLDAPHCIVCHDMTATQVELHGTFASTCGLCKRCYMETLKLLELCGARGLGVLASSQYTAGKDYPQEMNRWNGTGTGIGAPIPHMATKGAHTTRSAHEHPDEDDVHGNEDEDEDVSPSRTLKGSPAQRFFDDDNAEHSTVMAIKQAPLKKK